MAHVRFRNRETPKSEIECQIGETVDPKKVCPKCAYATGCPNYEIWLKNNEEEDEYSPCIEAEKLIIEKRGRKDLNQVAERRRRMRAEVRKAVEERELTPDLEGETSIRDTHNDVHKNGESKWCPFCMGIRLKRKLGKIKLELQYKYWQLRVWFDNHKLRYWNYE